MKAEKSISRSQETQINEAGRTVEVLYQKLGERWFAFSMIDDEIFFSPVSENEIRASGREQPIFIKAGNS